jgi:hypothetical protein
MAFETPVATFLVRVFGCEDGSQDNLAFSLVGWVAEWSIAAVLKSPTHHSERWKTRLLLVIASR